MIVPLDGGPVRHLTGLPPEPMVFGVAVSPGGRKVATAFGVGQAERTLHVWDVDTGQARVFPLPAPDPPEDPGSQPTGLEGGIASLLFDDETTLFSFGDGGIRRWDLATSSQTSVVKAVGWFQLLSREGQSALVRVVPLKVDSETVPRYYLADLVTGSFRPTREVGEQTDLPFSLFFEGPLVATASGTPNGLIRVGRNDGSPLHILAGHVGPAQLVAISPDLKWVASTGEDNTLRLWPMPDLSKPPLHTLPHDELIAKLKSLTNLRAVPDPTAENGWKIELDQFPGWKSVPAW